MTAVERRRGLPYGHSSRAMIRREDLGSLPPWVLYLPNKRRVILLSTWREAIDRARHYSRPNPY